jgi:hypothetical protein
LWGWFISPKIGDFRDGSFHMGKHMVKYQRWVIIGDGLYHQTLVIIDFAMRNMWPILSCTYPTFDSSTFPFIFTDFL